MVADLTELAAQEDAPRVVFFGMECSFSLPVLTTLLGSGVEVCAIVMPAAKDLFMLGSSISSTNTAIFRLPATHIPGGLLPMMQTGYTEERGSIVRLAQREHIPVWCVRNLAAQETRETLASYQPDLICVACFSQVIPSVILSLPRLGCVNVHPSLLPALRGPEPIFWAFHKGCMITGTTIHFMVPKLDSGAILAQETIAIPDGISATVLEEHCAHLGGKLLAQVVFALMHGHAHSYLQDETQSSYQSYPQAEDYMVTAQEWEARHLYNFICGVADDTLPVILRVHILDAAGAGVERYLSVSEALEYDNAALLPLEGNDPATMMPGEASGEWIVACRQGWVRVRESGSV